MVLVTSLAKLHNFCVDQNDANHKIYASDEAYIELHGAVPMDRVQHSGNQSIPLQLIGAGNHFDDITASSRRQRIRAGQLSNKLLPCQQMLQKMSNTGVTRPISSMNL